MARRVLFISLWLPEQPDNSLTRTDRRYGDLKSPAKKKNYLVQVPDIFAGFSTFLDHLEGFS
jgi:hypothetical protein